MKTVKFYTLGCKVNQYDTQSIREKFLRSGFKEVDNQGKADTCLINTCTVTATAEQKSRNIIRRLIRENPKAKIIVTGCLVDDKSQVLSKIKGADFFIGKRFFSDGINDFKNHTRAFLKIQDGCDNFCSYCKVPLVRGRSRSRPIKEIVKEAGRLAKKGFKEIVLTGICLGSFSNLVGLIKELEKIKGILRIRLSSIEAGEVSNDLIELIASSKKLCPHLHIPIQSGDDAILKKMNRKYTRAGYLKLIKKIKSRVKDVAITTDVLVGFPGETEKQFQNTCGLVRKILPLRTHIFPYSPRSGTKAAQLKNRVSCAVVKSRITRLKEIAENSSQDFRRQYIGKRRRVLIETSSRHDPLMWEGYTDNYIKARIHSRKNLKNKLIVTRI